MYRDVCNQARLDRPVPTSYTGNMVQPLPNTCKYTTQQVIHLQYSYQQDQTAVTMKFETGLNQNCELNHKRIPPVMHFGLYYNCVKFYQYRLVRL